MASSHGNSTKLVILCNVKLNKQIRDSLQCFLCRQQNISQDVTSKQFFTITLPCVISPNPLCRSIVNWEQMFLRYPKTRWIQSLLKWTLHKMRTCSRLEMLQPCLWLKSPLRFHDNSSLFVLWLVSTEGVLRVYHSKIKMTALTVWALSNNGVMSPHYSPLKNNLVLLSACGLYGCTCVKHWSIL